MEDLDNRINNITVKLNNFHKQKNKWLNILININIKNILI